jgi:hypothetical protein
MNEQAIQDAYNLFVSNGYKKSINDFKKLIATNPQALQDSYSLFVSNGYQKPIDDYKVLMGIGAAAPVKKKDTTGFPSEGGSSVSSISDKFQQPQAIQRDATFVKPPVMPMGGPKPVNLGGAPTPTPVAPKPKQEEQGYGDYLFNSLAAGAATFNEAVFSIPETVLNIFAIPQNLIAEATGWDISTNAEEFKDYFGIKNPLLDWAKEDKKILSGEVSNYVAKNYKESGIVNNFANGNYQDGFEQLGASIAQSVPISLGIMMGGAYAAPEVLAAATTVGLTEGQREELRQMDPNMKESELMMKALGMSAAESVFSAIGTGTIGQVYRDIAAREGKQAAAQILKDGLVKTYKTALEKGGMAVGFAGEGIEEAATQITQNVIAGKPAFENVADAFVTGAGSGVVFTAPISAVNAKNYVKGKAETYSTKDKIGQILKDEPADLGKIYNVPVGTEITPQQLDIANLPKSRDVLASNLKKQVEAGDITQEDAKQSLYVFDKIQQVSNSVKDLEVSVDDKAKIATLLSERDALKTKIQNKDDVLVVQEKQQIEAINKQIQEILLKPKQDAVQEQSTDESLLRSEGPQVGLQEMGEGDKGPQVATQKIEEEKVGPKYVKDISVLITPATVRSSDETTARMKDMTVKYDGLVKQYNETKDEALIPQIRGLEEQILNDTKQEIVDRVAKVPGTKVAFKDHKMGSWQGNFEPAFNMTLSVTPQANTKELSNMLFDFSEKYSQDAFILESDSDDQNSVFNDTVDMPFTEERDGLLYYPQLGFSFSQPISREKMAELSNKLNEQGIEAFNMNDNELKVSIITFLGDEQSKLSPEEQYNLKQDEYERQSAAIATAVKEVLGPDAVAGANVKIRRSKYTGATNEGTADQTRTYDRGDVFEAFQKAPTEVENLTKEYNVLRDKQIELSKTKQQLTAEEQDRLDELAAMIQPTVEKTFEVNEQLYKDAKVEADAIAADATKGMNAFVSGFPIKRPSRASIKTMRWYGGFTEKLGDGARLNIIVENPADVDKVYNEINSKYPTTDPDLRRINENTELGYPKRLIEVRMSNGVIAEMQVMTPQAYLAKDGVNGFQGKTDFAKTELKRIQDKLGWKIPDGLGHYFYEVQRDFNVDDNLRNEATELSNKYYEAFTNPDSTLPESFMDEVLAFKDKVDAADKTNWDRGNEGIAPESLEQYAESRPEVTAEQVLTADNTDKTTLQKTLDFLDKVEKDLDAFGRGNLSMGVAIPVMKAIIKSVKVLVKTGITLQEAIKRAAAENKVSEQDVVDTIKAVAEMQMRAGKAEGATEMELPGYNRMQKELQGIIEKSRERGATEEKAMQNAIDYLQKSRVYQDATDVQRERMVRDVRKEFGKREKAAPKPEKLFGEIQDVKKITMSEKELLKKQLMDKARGAKDAKKVWMATSQALAKYVKGLADGGKISTKQAATVLRKFSGVNMFDEASIGRFVDYMAKVFENAQYAEQLAAISKALPIARKNVRSKIGIAEGVAPQMMRLFSINPSLIPDAVFDKYMELVTMMGERKAVLKLDEVSELTKKVDNVLTAVDEEVSLAEELADRFESYADKVIDEDGKLDYPATIKKMVEDEVITEDEAAVMRKYKSKVLPMVERVKQTEEESAEEKEVLVKAAQQAEVTTTELPTADERKLARELARLVKTDAVKGLDNSQLKNLLRVIDNINNGFLPHFAELMVERLNAINNAKTLKTAVENAKPLKLSAVYSKLKSMITKKEAMSELIRRNPLYYIDQVFGDFKTKAIFNSLFEKAADAQARYSSAVTELQNRLDKAEEAVFNSFGKDANDTLMSKFKMMTYMVQLEYNANPDNKQVNPASKYLDATIEHIRNGKSSFGERDAKMLEEIRNDKKYQDSDGEIDVDKLYNSFNSAEKGAIKTIQDINESMRDKAVYTAAIIRGDKINPLNNYVHLNTLHEHRPDEAISGVAFVDDYNNSMRPSTKAKSLIERTGKVAPLNFDVFASANRGAKFVLMDYHLTEPIRTARKTINETSKLLKEEGNVTKEKRDIFNAIDRAFEEAVEDLLTSNFTATSFGDDVVNFISKQGYRAVLASAPRFVAELTSNLGFALVMAPKDFATGVKQRGVVLSADAPKILNNVESKQTNRLFPNDTLSGKLVDTAILNQASGIKGGRAQNDVANKIQQIYNLSLKKYTNLVELGADALIATPDKIVMRPLWFGTFANEFKKATGKEVDFDKIASNDETYMADNRDAIEASRMAADEKSVAAGASDNAFMGLLKGTAKPNQSAMLRGFNMFNSFMTRFLIYEYITARTGIMAAVGNGSVSKKQGAAMLAAVATRMTMYTILSSILAETLASLFVDDEEKEDEKSLMQKVGQAMASSASSLLLGRDFGNATKSVINYGVERANEKYLDFLREGEYDPYKDALQFTVIPKEQKGKKTDAGDLIMNMMGPFGPAAKTVDLAIRKATEPEKKEADAIQRSEMETQVRLPLEVLGNLGMIPLYKDVRKVVNKEIYKDLEKAEETPSKPIMNKEDMKRYNPELYNQLYGPDAPTYEIEQMKKQMRKEKEAMMRQMKDEMYR